MIESFANRCYHGLWSAEDEVVLLLAGQRRRRGLITLGARLPIDDRKKNR